MARAKQPSGPYYSRKGVAAIAGAAAASGRLAALKDRLLDQTGNGYQRQKLGCILDLHLAASAEGIADHVAAQQDVYNRGVAAAAIRTAQAEATADPSVMPQATMRAEDAARVVHAGEPPEAVEAGVRAAAGSLVAGVIGDRLDPTARRTLGAAAEMLSNSVAADAWLRERSATLRTPAPNGDATLDAVNAADASTAEPLPVVSSGGALIEPEDGIVGTRQRLAEIEERHRALTALNRQEFAANPARLRANQAAIDIETVRSRAAEKAETDGLYADLRRYLTTGGPDGGPALALPPAPILSRLTEAQQDAVTAQVKANIAGRKIPKIITRTGYCAVIVVRKAPLCAAQDGLESM